MKSAAYKIGYVVDKIIVDFKPTDTDLPSTNNVTVFSMLLKTEVSLYEEPQ